MLCVSGPVMLHGWDRACGKHLVLSFTESRAEFYLQAFCQMFHMPCWPLLLERNQFLFKEHNERAAD